MKDPGYTYVCEAGHEAWSRTPLPACPACIKGDPCPATLERVGPGSRSSKK